jgi:hypothetical protein
VTIISGVLAKASSADFTNRSQKSNEIQREFSAWVSMLAKASSTNFTNRSQNSNEI